MAFVMESGKTNLVVPSGNTMAGQTQTAARGFCWERRGRVLGLCGLPVLSLRARVSHVVRSVGRSHTIAPLGRLARWQAVYLSIPQDGVVWLGLESGQRARVGI